MASNMHFSLISYIQFEIVSLKKDNLNCNISCCIKQMYSTLKLLKTNIVIQSIGLFLFSFLLPADTFFPLTAFTDCSQLRLFIVFFSLLFFVFFLSLPSAQTT